MTDDEIMAVALQTEMTTARVRADLVAFGQRIAAAERERCAQMCEAYAAEGIGREMAEAIRRME